MARLDIIERNLTIIITAHEVDRQKEFRLSINPDLGIIIGRPERISNGDPFFSADYGIIELFSYDIAEIQGELRLAECGKLGYTNLVSNGASFVRDQDRRDLGINSSVKLVEEDKLLFGNYESGPEYSITISRIESRKKFIGHWN